MAITKQINQLNNAGEIQSSDYVALAQSGQSEATKATISDLAAAVGELNSTGALAELELATSLGKNLLAQRLTEKGQTCSPSDTLISMADKLESLNIADADKSIIKAKLPTSYTIATISNFAHVVLPTAKAIVVYYQGVLYYINRENSATSISELLASAQFSIDTGLGNVTACIATNMTETHVAVSSSGTSYLIYTIGQDSFTLLNNVTTPTSRSTSVSNHFILNNTGTKLAYKTNSTTLKIYDTGTGTEASLTVEGHGSVYCSYYGYMNDTTIWYLESRTSGTLDLTEYGYFNKLEILDNGNNDISLISQDQQTVNNAEATLICVNKQNVYAIASQYKGSTGYMFDTTYNMLCVPYNFYYTPSDYFTFYVYVPYAYGTNSTSYGHYLMRFDCYDSYDSTSNSISYEIPGLASPLIIDINNRTVSGNVPTNPYKALPSLLFNIIYLSSGYIYDLDCVVISNDKAGNCLMTKGREGVNFTQSANKSVTYYSYTVDPQYVGFLRFINGLYMSYLFAISNATTLSLDYVKNGAFSLDTTKVILEEDSDESI